MRVPGWSGRIVSKHSAVDPEWLAAQLKGDGGLTNNPESVWGDVGRGVGLQ